MTRNDVQEVVFETIEDGGWNYNPVVGTILPKYRDFNENTKLIDELELDSLDITEIIANSCQKLGFDAGMAYGTELSSISTVKDIVDSIWNGVQ